MVLALLVPPLRMILLMVVGTLIPVPLVLLYLHRGKTTGLIGITAVALSLWFLMGPAMAIGFITMYGVVAAALAEATRLSLSFQKTIAVSTLAPAVLSLMVLLAGFAGTDGPILEELERTFMSAADSSLQALQDAGESPQRIGEIRKSMEETVPVLVQLLPAILLTGYLMGAVINFLAVRFLWRKFYSHQYFEGMDVSRWMLSDGMVWILIASLATLFVGSGFSLAVGMNLSIVFVYLYLLQGLAVVTFILKAKAMPKWVWVIVFVLIPLNPMFLGLVIGIGLFDIWLDFRKIRVMAPPQSPE